MDLRPKTPLLLGSRAAELMAPECSFSPIPKFCDRPSGVEFFHPSSVCCSSNSDRPFLRCLFYIASLLHKLVRKVGVFQLVQSPDPAKTSSAQFAIFCCFSLCCRYHSSGLCTHCRSKVLSSGRESWKAVNPLHVPVSDRGQSLTQPGRFVPAARAVKALPAQAGLGFAPRRARLFPGSTRLSAARPLLARSTRPAHTDLSYRAAIVSAKNTSDFAIGSPFVCAKRWLC